VLTFILKRSESPRRQRQLGAVLSRRVLDERLAARDHREPVQVEEREPGAPEVLHVEARASKGALQQLRGEVAAVPDVLVERRHRPGRDGDDEPASGSQVGAHVPEHRARIVEVLEHLGADGERRPSSVSLLELHRLREILLEELRLGDLAPRELDPALRQIEPDHLRVLPRDEHLARELTRTAPEIEEPHRRRLLAEREELEDELVPVDLGGIERVGRRILIPVRVPVVSRGAVRRGGGGHASPIAREA